MGRNTQLSIEDENGRQLAIYKVNYGSKLFFKNGDKIKSNTKICEWDPYNGVIISDYAGKISYENIEQGLTFEVEIDEQTGFQEKVIIESRNKKLINKFRK